MTLVELPKRISNGGSWQQQNDDDDSSETRPLTSFTTARQSSFGETSVCLILGACFVLTSAIAPAWIFAAANSNAANRVSNPEEQPSVPSIAMMGNSMQYYNDCPTLVELLLREMYNTTSPTNKIQDSCLHGGANLASLWEDGNGMAERFAGNPHNPSIGAATVLDLLDEQDWDYVLLQDLAQFPIHEGRRQESLNALRDHYLPAIQQQQQQQQQQTKPPPTILFLQTFPPLSAKIREQSRLGSFDQFAEALWDGYRAYQQEVPNSRLVPVGKAVQHLQAFQPQAWEQLYHTDDLHPSPHGTWLQALCIMAVVTGRAPPKWSDERICKEWKKKARFWATAPSGDPLPLPTFEEAECLRQVACRITLKAGRDVDARAVGEEDDDWCA